MCIDPAGMINQERMLYMLKKDVTNKAKIKPTYEIYIYMYDCRLNLQKWHYSLPKCCFWKDR